MRFRLILAGTKSKSKFLSPPPPDSGIVRLCFELKLQPKIPVNKRAHTRNSFRTRRGDTRHNISYNANTRNLNSLKYVYTYHPGTYNNVCRHHVWYQSYQRSLFFLFFFQQTRRMTYTFDNASACSSSVE